MNYAAFIFAIARPGNEAAVRVKIADLEDNSDPARLARLPAKEAMRLERKYTEAKTLLRDTLRAMTATDVDGKERL